MDRLCLSMPLQARAPLEATKGSRDSGGPMLVKVGNEDHTGRGGLIHLSVVKPDTVNLVGGHGYVRTERLSNLYVAIFQSRL